MLTLSTDHVIYEFSPHNSPAAEADSGEIVRFETMDCFSNQVHSEDQNWDSVDWAAINPATGPLFVRGAEPGDTLKVEILSIELGPQAVIMEFPGSGVTGCMVDHIQARVLPIKGDTAVFSDDLVLPLNPMIGSIGTAPAEESISTEIPASHGGNMDCTKIGVGTTLYLPVNVPGALLAMGDIHALMGDGEVCVSGAEIRGAITVRVTALKNARLPLPFLVNETLCAAIGSSPTLQDAATAATMAMREFLVNTANLDPHSAATLLSLTGDLRICQVVNPQKTCRMELPRQVVDKFLGQFP